LAKTKEKKPYLTVNLPREWGPYLEEALLNPEIRKKLEIGEFTMTSSGLGNWVIREFLIHNTSFHYQHFNTYDDHATIIDNKIRRMIDIYPKEEIKELWCEYCDSTNCEHVKFARTVPKIMEPLEKKGWRTSKNLIE